MLSDKNILNSLLADISGVSRIESEDPRWIQLFSTAHMLSLANENLADEYCDLLITNNKTTGNFVQLLEHTTSRISQMSATRLNPNGQSIDQCCMALYLSTILFHYLIASLSSKELRLQLFLPIKWPITAPDSLPLTPIIDGLKVIESLLDELVIAIDQPLTSPWMHDVKFFCTNLLLTMASTQLYQNADPNVLYASATSGSVDDDLFLAYLYRHSESQLRDALHNGSSYSSAFSSSTGVRLVRGLFVSGLLESQGANTSPPDTKIQPHSSLLAALQQHHSFRKQEISNNTKSVTSSGPSLQSSVGIYWGMITSPILTMQQWWQGQLALITSRRGLLLAASPRQSSSPSGEGEKKTDAVTSQQRIVFPSDPLAERSLNLLLVLLHNNRSATSRNPFREIFGMLQDDSIGSDADDGGMDDDVELMSRGKGALVVSSLHVDFRRAIRGLESNLPSESSALLLYSLLHSHPTFADMLLATDSAHLLLDRCLYGLHFLTSSFVSSMGRGEATTDCQSSSRLSRMYILVICLLLVLQDGMLMARLMSMRVQAPWYKERQLHNIALLDLVTLCVLRSVMHAVFRAKDAYLLGNCCAVLHNVSTQAAELHPYTSERVVKMTYQLAGRIAAWANASNESSLATAPRLLVEAFCSLVRFISTALRPSSRLANAHLLYALIHDFELIERNLSAPGLVNVLVALGDPFVDALQQLPCIVRLAQIHLMAIEQLRGDEGEGRYFSADEAIASLRESLIRAESEGLAVPLIEQAAPLESYCYQEGERPEDFFVPCVWTAAIGNSPEVAWRFMDIALFNPYSAGFVSWQSADDSSSRRDAVGVSSEEEDLV